jgi:hypothetical protein
VCLLELALRKGPRGNDTNKFPVRVKLGEYLVCLIATALLSVLKDISESFCMEKYLLSLVNSSVGHEYQYSNTNPEYYSPNIRIGRFS